MNQYTSLSGSPNFTIVYDNNGNIIDNGKYVFQYDYKNRLRIVKCGAINSECTEGEIVVSFEYDILGRRISKGTTEKQILYIYSNDDIVQEIETISGTTITKDYINWLWVDDLVAYKLDGELYYYHKNHLGSVVALSDENGEVVIEYDYDVFGKTYVETLSGSIAIENYEGNDYSNYRLFTGREWDGEVDLYYYRARFYDVEIGRFISRDPIGVKDDVNLYAYVGNNPVMFVDAMGMEKALAYVVNLFNSYGALWESLAKLLKEPDWSGPIDTWKRIIYRNEKLNSVIKLFKKRSNWDLKNNQYLTKVAKESGLVIDEKRNDSRESGWFLEINNQKIRLADLGNLFIWYYGSKLDIPLGDINQWTFLITLNSRKDYTKTKQNEEADKYLYKAWYRMWLETITWQLTTEKILDYMSEAVTKREEIDRKYSK